MDEEDLQELRESRTIVDTTQEMDLTGGTAAEMAKRQGGDDSEQAYVFRLNLYIFAFILFILLLVLLSIPYNQPFFRPQLTLLVQKY